MCVCVCVLVVRCKENATTGLHLGALAAQRGQCANQSDVESGQGDERDGQHQRRVQDVVVDDAVHLVVSEPRVARLDHVPGRLTWTGAVDWRRRQVTLAEARHVVEQDAGEDDAELQLGLPHCAQPRSLPHKHSKVVR